MVSNMYRYSGRQFFRCFLVGLGAECLLSSTFYFGFRNANGNLCQDYAAHVVAVFRSTYSGNCFLTKDAFFSYKVGPYQLYME